MEFPDMHSLTSRAKLRNFRQPNENETEEEYRLAFHQYMLGIDRIEAAEIKLGRQYEFCKDHAPDVLLEAAGVDVDALMAMLRGDA